MDNTEKTVTEEQEHKRFQRFLSRLRVFHRVPKFPIRNWMAWLGIALFIALVIAYYALGGGK